LPGTHIVPVGQSACEEQTCTSPMAHVEVVSHTTALPPLDLT
jgi:hypothetical protein